MCVITDYSPESLTLDSADMHTNAVVEVKTSESKNEASYVSTYWAKKDEMQCSANHEGFGELEGEDPESASLDSRTSQYSCDFPYVLLFTDENLNTLSLSHLGLRIILTKAMFFNVLMTVLMWKKK
ncbi:TCA protein, partial [Centropus bengalensis]|nr:TCA protein [Centropus bengalensis]